MATQLDLFRQVKGDFLSGQTLNIGYNKVTTNVDTGSFSDNQLVTKAYADSIAAGFDPKESVRLATLDDVGGSYSSSGGTGGTGSFTGIDFTSGTLFDLDSITVAVGDRVLVKDQTDAKENGIYVVTTAGAAGAMERASDQDGTPSNEVSGGNYTFVETGASSIGGYAVVGDGVLTLNTDDITWTQTSGSGSYVWGDGLSATGSTINVGAGNGITAAADTIAVNADTTGGANLAQAINVSANGVAIKIDDISVKENGSSQLVVNPGTTNGTSIEVSATGVELTSQITGARDFSPGDDIFEVHTGSGQLKLNSNATDTGTITIGNTSSTSDVNIVGGNTTSTAINIWSDGGIDVDAVGVINLTSAQGNPFIEVGGSTVDINTSGNHITNIGHASSTSAINILAGSSTISVKANDGSNNGALDLEGGGAVNINSGSMTGTITIGNDDTGSLSLQSDDIDIGTGTNTNTISIGNNNTTAASVIGDDIDIGNTSTTDVTVNAATVNIGTSGTDAPAINIGHSDAGNITIDTDTTIDIGSANTNAVNVAADAVNIQTTGSGSTSIGSNGGSVTIGGTSAASISMWSGNSISIQAGVDNNIILQHANGNSTGNINIGTSETADITIGSVSSGNLRLRSSSSVELDGNGADNVTLADAPTSTDDSLAVATTAFVWDAIDSSTSGASAKFYDAEVPSGAVNGVNDTFTLTADPGTGKGGNDALMLFVNGMLQKPGDDYSLATNTITMTTAPETGYKLLAFYRI